jgi:hypothetical protein
MLGLPINTILFNSGTLTSLSIVGVFIAIWSFIRVGRFRDEKKRRLPYNLLAEIVFVLTQLLIYGLVTLVLFAFYDPIYTKLHGTDFAEMMQNLRANIPLLGLFGWIALMQFGLFSELNDRIMLWTHSAIYLPRDANSIAYHISNCKYIPSPEEQNKNIEHLENAFAVKFTDGKTNLINSATAQRWRKTEALLRFFDHYEEDNRAIFTSTELETINDWKQTHEQKTKLALAIIKILQRNKNPLEVNEILQRLSEGLSSLAVDRRPADELEKILSVVAKAQNQEALKKQQDFSSDDFNEYLRSIEGYFEVEYRKLLGALANLASISVLYSPNDGERKLAYLRKAGFQGFGTLETFNFSIVLGIFLIGFAVAAATPIVGGVFISRPVPITVLLSFAFGLAIATVIGAIIGSKRLVEKPSIAAIICPVLGGLASAFVLIELFSYATDGITPPPPNPRIFGQCADRCAVPPPQTLVGFIPLAALPFFFTLGIAFMARFDNYARPGFKFGVRERFIDGAVMLLVAQFALFINFALGLALATSFADCSKCVGLFHSTTIFRVLIISSIAFAIGFAVIREVRKAAHSRLIES